MSHEKLVRIFDWLKIVAIVCGLCSPLIAGYVSNEVSKAVVHTEMDNVKDNIREIKNDVKELRTDIKELLRANRK